MKQVRIALAVLLLSGCGSTVAGVGADRTADQGLGPQTVATQGTNDLPVDVPSSTGTTGGASSTTSGGSVVQGSTGAQSPTDLPTADNPVSLPSSLGGANGPGVTDKAITIGLSYYENAAAANAALGAGGVKTSDPVAGTRALIDDINVHGGIAGRKINIITFGIDPQSPTPYASSAQQMCTYFTQDHKVFAMIDGAPAAGGLAKPCLAKHGVVYLGGSLLGGDDFVSTELDPLTLTWPHMFAALPGVLAQQGWFGTWNYATAATGALPVKVGVLTVDDGALSKAVTNVLVPGLRRVGHAPAAADIVRITPPQGFTDDGAVVAAIHGAVLRFRADGVTHVILTDSNGSMSLLFQNDAKAQGYYPRLGGTTGNGWQVLVGGGSVPPKTLNGAMGMGWEPLLDLPWTRGEGPMTNPARHACFTLFAKHGTTPSDGNTASSEAAACDIAYLLPKAFAGYKGPVDGGLFLKRVAALGTSYGSAGTLGLRFAVGKKDGIGAYSPMQYDAGCTCFKYLGRRGTL